MKNYFKIITSCIVIMILFAHCKQIYDPKVEAKNIKLLVVEGYLNSGPGPTVIHLSRTIDLQDTLKLDPELGAQVNVEGDNGSNFTLTESAGGEYSMAQITFDNNAKYRVHIRTIEGKEYVSDFASVKHTPPIDSITWQRENSGLRLYVNAHDPQNAAKYYEWKYGETWEFHSAFYSSLKYIWDSSLHTIRLAFRNPNQTADTTIYKCWKTLNTTSIILGSTEKLTDDIAYLPVQYIEPHSEKLSVLYSLNLRQYAISHEKYLFLQKMKKNTEQLGTIFDPQPSELLGNIHCLTDPTEVVIGFVEVTQEQTKRIFIYNSQVNGWNYNPGCFLVKIDTDSTGQFGFDLTPTNLISSKSFYASAPQCVDCTIGRTNQKPPFWP